MLSLLRGELAPPGSDPRWSGALAMSRRHGVAPLLHESARGLPDAIARELRRERAAAVAETCAREAAEARTLAALQGLRPVLLKGAAYARTLYASPELRPRGDFDVLVSPEVAGAAASRLSAQGYRRHPRACGGVQDDPARHEQTLVHAREPRVVLDLHRGFCQPERMRPDVAALVARAVEAPGTPPGVLVLSADDAVLAHAINLATHELRVPLVQVADFARLWARCQPDVVVARARSYRLEHALWCALRLLEECCADGPEHDAVVASFGGQSVDLVGLRKPGRELLERQPRFSRRGLEWLVGRYDLARRPLGRIEQLARKALLIDRTSDRWRFLVAHGAALVRSAARPRRSTAVLSWAGR